MPAMFTLCSLSYWGLDLNERLFRSSEGGRWTKNETNKLDLLYLYDEKMIKNTENQYTINALG